MKFKQKKEMPTRYVLLIFTSIALILLLVSVFFSKPIKPLHVATSTVLTPMQNGLNTLGQYVSNKINMFQKMEKLQEENEVLKQQLDTYSNEAKTYQQDVYELNRLRELYDLDEKYKSYNKVAARVIASNSDNWFDVFYIDKGANDGISVDCNVLAGEGLCGIVVAVGPNWAEVRTIIDESSNISAMIVSDSAICNVYGDLKSIEDGYIHVENIYKDAVVNTGDEVVTSNISDKYFEGITIGYIDNIVKDSNDLTESADLIPVVDFNNIQEVLVITEKKQIIDKSEEIKE